MYKNPIKNIKKLSYKTIKFPKIYHKIEIKK